ncbi:signal recognition particle protein [Mycobacterium sp. PO1]|uniref:Uncharacterized protein n=1 Tax=Mycolicibacterium parafortuitum TaxID=39692 RepID=A0ACC6MJ24_MYCPF|nr:MULTISPECIES: hypothetical protein [Mycobacteriaceae]MBX7449768.1 hypothetical protein [Mycolicibacterium aurantiacum]MDZ5086935.1 hypothetical protein [Mycolicibacterium parafortuitum]GFM15994.1 signal recognition particle protein [Mycobacterium sp. PO1]GFM24390.1 signal recognition particle protein [Mycobacterium sp. PO2]
MKEILSVAGQVLSGGAEGERPAVTATAALMIGFGICHMVVLLLGCQIAGRGRSPWPLAERYAEEGARLLSSCDNNRNNPQRGTDPLRGAS